MLVLSRRMGEGIQVGDDVRITVVRIADGTVRIGIEAPQQMPIMREELVDGRAVRTTLCHLNQ